MILSLARIVSRVRFCSCHKPFFLLVWYPQLPSNKVTTAFPLTSPVWDQGVRTGLLSMTNSALSCFIHEELMCKSLSVKKMFTIGEVPIDVSSVTSSWAGCYFASICHKSFFLSVWYPQLPSNKVALQTSLLMNMSRDASPKCVSVWPFNYHRSLVFFRLSLVWNSFYTLEIPNLLVCRLPRRYIDQGFSSVLRPEVYELHCRRPK